MTGWGIVLPMWAAIVAFAAVIYITASDMWGVMGGIAALLIVSVGAVANVYFGLRSNGVIGNGA